MILALLAAVCLGWVVQEAVTGALEFQSETLGQQPRTVSREVALGELILTQYQTQGHISRALSARIAARGCGARRSPKRPPMPNFVLLGVMKSGTTDLHFRTNNASWAYGGDRKESHWFETACSGRIGDRLREISVPLEAGTRAPSCPTTPAAPPKLSRQRRLPINPEFPELQSDIYLQNCSAWHFQHFFKGGAYECSAEPPFTPSADQAPPMGVWPSSTGDVDLSSPPPSSAPPSKPPRGMWFDGGPRAEFAGWRVSHDASPKLLPMVDGPAAAAATAPLARMVMQFRHPVERAWSHYFHVRYGNASAQDLTPEAFHRTAQEEVSNFRTWGEDVAKHVEDATRLLSRLSALAREAAAGALGQGVGGVSEACMGGSSGAMPELLPAACVHVVDAALGAALRWVQGAGLGVSDKGYRGGIDRWHMPAVHPPSLERAAVRDIQAAVQQHLRSPEIKRTREAYRRALGQVLATWRRIMLASYDGYDFDNFKNGGTVLTRGLYAAQTLRLFSLVPPSEVFFSQAEEYYRDPKPVLAALQSWLCVPMESPPCTKGHPFLRSQGGQDVVARPSAPKYSMLPESNDILSAAIAPHMAQHARLLGVLGGSDDGRLAQECARSVGEKCGEASADTACSVAAVQSSAACRGIGVGPLASVALLQLKWDKGGRDGGGDILQRLQHRWNKQTWNTTLLEPGNGLQAVKGGGYLDLLGGVPAGDRSTHSSSGGTQHPRGKMGYSAHEVSEATSWASCSREM